ncbi:hypothetical protein E7Z54_16580, partial [Nocardioides sp.]
MTTYPAGYLAGELATLVTVDGVVLTTPDRLADVVDLAERGIAPLTVVEVLSRGTLSSLPDFVAAAVVDAEVRVVVRGAFTVRVDGFAVDGEGVATWTERSIPLVPGAVVEVMPVGSTPVGPALPLTGGVVRSGGVRWVPFGSPSGAPAPARATATATVTTPESVPVPERTVVKRPRPGSSPPSAPPSGMPT